MSCDPIPKESEEMRFMKALPRAQRRRIERMLYKGVSFEATLIKEGFKFELKNQVVDK